MCCIENDYSINPWVKKWLTAKYKRCLDKLNKNYVRRLLNDGKVEEAITHLSIQSSFRLRLLAYSILMNNGELNRAQNYLDSLQTKLPEEQNFVTAQNIFIDYVENRNTYTLSAQDSTMLYNIGIEENPYSGYARSIFYKLTGERIDINLPQIIRNNPRNIIEDKSNLLISIYPNPTNRDGFYINIDNFDNNANYNYSIESIEGKNVKQGVIKLRSSNIELNENNGIYILQLYKNKELLSSEKIIKI